MIKKLYRDSNSQRDLDEVCRILRDGGVVVLPTDTVYAICCHALKERAIERVCQLKQIDLKQKSLSVAFSDLSQISEYVNVENSVFKLLKENLPGPFTFILPSSNRLPKIFKNRKEVGIRIPDDFIFQSLIEALGEPIMTTSVPYDEADGFESITDPELIDERFGSVVDLVIDGGIGGTEPSTVISCVGGDSEIVRMGKGELKE